MRTAWCLVAAAFAAGNAQKAVTFLSLESRGGCRLQNPELNGACPEDARWAAAFASAPSTASTAASAATSNAAAEACTSTSDWKCLCQATEHAHRSLSTRHTPTLLGYTTVFHELDEIVKNASDVAATTVRARAETTGSVSGALDEICPHGHVYNPLSDYVALHAPHGAHGAHGAHGYSAKGRACHKHLPIYRAFPPSLAAAAPYKPSTTATPADNDGARGLVREWLGNVRPWAWDCVANTCAPSLNEAAPARVPPPSTAPPRVSYRVCRRLGAVRWLLSHACRRLRARCAGSGLEPARGGRGVL